LFSAKLSSTREERRKLSTFSKKKTTNPLFDRGLLRKGFFISVKSSTVLLPRERGGKGVLGERLSPLRGQMSLWERAGGVRKKKGPLFFESTIGGKNPVPPRIPSGGNSEKKSYLRN